MVQRIYTAAKFPSWEDSYRAINGTFFVCAYNGKVVRHSLFAILVENNSKMVLNDGSKIITLSPLTARVINDLSLFIVRQWRVDIQHRSPYSNDATSSDSFTYETL